MSADMNILILGKLNTDATVTQINTQLAKNIQSKLQHIELQVKLDPQLAQRLAQNIQTITQSVHQQTAAYNQQSGSVQQMVHGMDQLIVKTNLLQTDNGYGGIYELVKKTTNEAGEQLTVISRINKETGEMVETLEIVDKNFKKQRQEAEKLADAMARGREQSAVRQKSADRSAELKQTEAINRALEREIELKRTRVGVFDELRGQQVAEVELTKTLNSLYGDREIRAISVDRVTGRWSATLAENSAQNRVLKGTIDQTTGALYKQSEALTQVKSRNLGMMDELGIALKRIPTWFISMTLYVQAMLFFQGGVTYVNDLNKALTEISVVTGKSQQQVDALGVEYQKLAYQMSVTTKDIARASVEFYRQGLTQEEVMERVRVATQYAKISNIEFGRSSEILTATVNSMNVPIQKAADIFTLLGDMTATSPNEIGEAMQKAGGSMAALNIPLERAAAYIATISSKTRESGAVIGTALKSIVARYAAITATGFNEEDATNINDVTKALGALGIKATDAEGQLRNLPEVLDELGAMWGNLDDKQRSYIATTLAGRHHISRLYTLLNDYSQSLEMYDAALLATGTTQQKYTKYLQSTEAYLAKLQTAYTGIWQNVFGSEDIRTAISLLTSLTNGVGVLVKTFGFLPTVVTLATAAIIPFNAAVKTFVASLGAKIVGFLGLGPAIASVTLSLGLYTGAMGAATKAAILFKSVILPLAAIAAATFAVTKLVGAISKTAEANRVAAMEEKNAVETYKKRGKEIDNLVAKYKDLSSITSRTAEEEEELQRVQRQLAQILPSITTKLDAHGNVHIRNADKIEEELIGLRKLVEEYKNLDKKLEDQEKKRLDGRIRTIRGTISRLQTELHNYALNPDLFPEDERKQREAVLREHIKNLSEELKGLQETATLTKSATSKITPPKTPEPKEAKDGDPPKDPTIFDLSLHKIELVNAEIDKLKDSLETVTDIEQRQSIYDKMIVTYQQKQSILSGLLEWQKRELANAGKILRGKVGAEDYKKIVSGDFSNLLITDEATAKAIRGYQDLTSAVLQTEDSIRELNNEIVKTGQTAAKELERPIKAFDLTSRKITIINGKIAEMQDELEKATDIEDRAEIYDKMATAYTTRGNALKDILKNQKAQLAAVEQSLTKALGTDLMEQLRNGDIGSISIDDSAIISLVELFQSLTSEITNTESAIRSTDRELRDLGKTAEQELKDSTKRQVDLGMYLVDREIDRLQALKRQAREIADQRIAVIEAQINALESSNKAADETAEREKRIADILDLQIKLRNTLDEKNIRTLQQQAGGTWQYVYSADPDKVEHINEQIKDRQEDMAKWEKDLQRQKIIDALQADIQAIKNQVDEETMGFEKRIENLQTFKTEYGVLTSEFYGQTIGGLDKFIADVGAIEGNGYINRLKALRSFVFQFNALVDTMRSPSPDSTAVLLSWGATSGGGSGGNNSISASMVEISEFDTGGYTGRFRGGKLGVLHEKELILDSDDTQNLLAAVNLTRSMVDKLQSVKLLSPAGSNTVMNVQANFPNVTSSDEIKKAILSLPQAAIQQRFTPSFAGGN